LGPDRGSAAARGLLVRRGLGERGDRARGRHGPLAVGGQTGACPRRAVARDDALAWPAEGRAGRGRAVLGAARGPFASVYEELAPLPARRGRVRRGSGACGGGTATAQAD